MNDEPIRVLKAEDRATPPDPHVVAVELMELLRALADDALYLRALLTRPGADPIAMQSKAAHQAVDLLTTAGRARETGETLVQALRAARLFSAVYEDVGVSDGR